MSEDTLQKFLFEEQQIRGAIVRLNKGFERALQNHAYPPAVQNLLGEMMAAAVLLSSTLKFRGKLAIHARGSGPIGLLMAEATNRRTYRGIAKWNGENLHTNNLNELFGNAQLAITIDPEQGQRYQGIVPLERENTAECIAHYFEQSEQLDTQLLFFSGENSVCGLLLQKLPDYMEVDDQDAWNRISMLLQTLDRKEFVETSNEEMLFRLFHQESITLFDAESSAFECSCSRERSLASIQTLGRESALQLLEELAVIEVDCQFCQTHYEFNRDDIISLFGLSRVN